MEATVPSAVLKKVFGAATSEVECNASLLEVLILTKLLIDC